MRQISIGRLFWTVALGIICMVLPVGDACAEGLIPVPGATKVAEGSPVPWNIYADKLLYNEETQIYEAEGNVRLTSTDRSITADYATVNNKTHEADLNGKVTVTSGRNWLKGEHIVWHLDTQTGWVESGVIYFSENNFFIQGKSIAKVGANVYDLKEGFVTSCNPADPDWKIQFVSMKVTVGGSSITQDASFWAKDFPVAWWPYADLPIGRDRQSGVLLPAGGRSSLNGFEFEIPYYWAIRGDMDATFYAGYFEKRGFISGAEYRINNPDWGKGVWMFNFLDDQASPAYLDSQGYPFQTEDRYWLRGKQEVTLPWNIEAKIDVDYVSDKNFLQEFTIGSTSFNHTNDIFTRYFASSLMYDPTSLVRESDIYLEKKTESEILSLDFRYFENLGDQRAETTQMLPNLSFDIIPKQVDCTPAYYTLQSSVVNYTRDQGDTEQRLDVYPRIYYPMRWGNYLNIEPSVGLRADTYSIQWETNGPDKFSQRAIPDVDVELSSRLNREFPVDICGLTTVQNAIRPEVSYEYANQFISSRVPQIDQLDVDQSRNGVRYGFTTFLTGKDVNSSYWEFLRLKVFQFYNVEQPPIEDPIFETDNVLREGFSPIGIRLDFMPKKYFILSYDLDEDLSKNGQGRAQDLAMTFDSTQGHYVRIDYEQIPSLQVNEITATTYMKTYYDIYLAAYYDYSLSAGLIFSQGYGLRYIRGCWGMGAGYERVGSDNRFVFTLDLLGLGSLGGQSIFFGRPLFGEVIPGYQHPETWETAR